MNAPRKGYTGYNEAYRKASVKYQREKMDAFTIRVPKGMRAIIDAHRDLTGESIAEFTRRAVEETIERDRRKMREALKKETLTETVEVPE